ncbi:hypothetical protein HMPREF9177_01714, partial [Streptococcus intermedius F0413]
GVLPTRLDTDLSDLTCAQSHLPLHTLGDPVCVF